MAAVLVQRPLAMSNPRRSSTRAAAPGRLDLSSLPDLIQPSPPSNTLLITGLYEPSIFHPASLETIRNLLATHSPEPLLHFVPLKSFRRMVVAFPSTESALAIRAKLDGESIMGCRIRVYFGEPTPLQPADQHLQAPKSAKLFFISPPPSPPAGWQMRNEEPPNKEVHAEDLASALAGLTARKGFTEDEGEDSEMADDGSAGGADASEEWSPTFSRPQRSGSTTLVYHPGAYGHDPDLPEISVEDTTGSPGDLTPMEVDRKIFAHTRRPAMEVVNQ